MSDESPYKSKLLLEIKRHLPGFVALRHEDVRSAGIPDLSLTGYGKTTWWEAKHLAPRLKSKGIQELTMRRLAASGFARYIIWDERRSAVRTLIVHPKHFHELMPEAWCEGIDHHFIVSYMKKVHRIGAERL
jgi:hypothetical protein